MARSHAAVALRNIPAHAGKTYGATAELLGGKEHPRARGENLVKFDNGFETRGTSPRTRGKQRYLKILSLITGNIPAHAGKTLGEGGVGHVFPEHPRARGENPGGGGCRA